MSQENVEIVRASFDLYNRRELATLQSGVTEDAELFTFTEGRAEGRPFVGPEGVREWLESDAEAWEEISVEAHDLRDLGDRVLAIGHIKGRGRGSSLELDSPAAWLFEFRGGQVSYMRGYLDPAEALDAAGLREQEMSPENARILDRMYDAVRRGDRDDFVALHAPDAEVVPLILDIEGGGYLGHDGLRRFWSEIHTAFPDWHWEVEHVQLFDEVALVTLRICGHAKGSGVTIDQRAWHVVKLRQGEIVWWRVFRTEGEALDAAGMKRIAPGNADN